MGEIRALITSAGYTLVGEFVQRRVYPDSKWFVGKGKLEELREKVKATRADIAVFAGVLRPSQHHELEKTLKTQCFDRLRVILEIFAQHAHGREAKLQVDLAMLQYEIPILKEWIHSGTAGERPGFMAGGEYRVDAYYETVKRKIKKIRDELEAVRKERATRRDHRHQKGLHHVSLVGYANAGKSSLFNSLSGERVRVEDRLFTTLSTTTRALPETDRRILVTDTVGLVSDIPLWLVEAFQATFEEVYLSDLVLLLLDASDSADEFSRKLDLATRNLLSRTEPDRIQPVLTKCDVVDEMTVEARTKAIVESPLTRPAIPTSAETGQGLGSLRTLIAQEFRFPVKLTLRLPQTRADGSFMNWLYERTDVLSVVYLGRRIEVNLLCREQDRARIEARVTPGTEIHVSPS